MSSENTFEDAEYPGVVGYGPHEAYRRALSVRLKTKVDGGIFTVAATDFDYDVNANRADIFAPAVSQVVPSGAILDSASALYRPDLTLTTATRAGDTRYGYGKGRRHWLTLVTNADLIIKFNEKTAKAIRWKTASGPLHLPVAEIYNLFLRSDQSGGTAQTQVITAVAASALTGGMYFVVPSTNAAYLDKYFGLYFVKDSVGAQPTDARVTDWYPVAIAAANTATQVADAIEAVLEARTGYITSANNVADAISVIHAVATSMSDAYDGPGALATGMTFAAPSTNGTTGVASIVDLILV